MAPTALSWLGIVPATLAWLVISFPMSIFWRKKPIADPHMDMRGKTVIVTGANCGIGFRSAAWLSKMGATVILACRSTERGLAAEKAIKEELETPLASFPYRDTGRVVFHKLDLGDFESIRSFASTICQGYMNIDVLINNAGLNDGKMTKQGLDEVFGVNFLGHFLLTILLLEKLKNNFRGARIINVSSVVHRFSPSKPDFEASANGMDKMHNYQNSKLAMVLFTKELRRRLKGTQVSACAVSPGAVRSEIWRSWHGLPRAALNAAMAALFLDTDQGAAPSIHCAAAPPAALGTHLYHCPYLTAPACPLPFEMLGPYAGALPSRPSLPDNEPEISADLWKLSCRITGVDIEGEKAYGKESLS